MKKLTLPIHADILKYTSFPGHVIGVQKEGNYTYVSEKNNNIKHKETKEALQSLSEIYKNAYILGIEHDSGFTIVDMVIQTAEYISSQKRVALLQACIDSLHYANKVLSSPFIFYPAFIYVSNKEQLEKAIEQNKQFTLLLYRVGKQTSPFVNKDSNKYHFIKL